MKPAAADSVESANPQTLPNKLKQRNIDKQMQAAPHAQDKQIEDSPLRPTAGMLSPSSIPAFLFPTIAGSAIPRSDRCSDNLS